MSKDIRIEVIADTTGFAAGMKRAEESTKSLSGHITGLKTSVLGLAKSYGALVGVVAGGAAIRKSITDWEDLAKAHRQMVAQLEANKEAVAAVLPWVEKLDKTFEKLGFTNAQTQEAFTRLDRAAGSSAVAYKYMGLAADLARSRHIEFGQSALLVGKIIQGNVAALNRYGIIIPKGTTALEALRIVQQKLAGQAAAGVTPMERLQAVITDISAKLGGVAVEAFRKYLVELADWLDKSRNQERILRDVHVAMDALVTAIHVITVALQTAIPVIKKVIDQLGGLRNVVIALIGLKLAVVFTSWGNAAAGSAVGVRGLALAFRSLGPAMAIATAAYIAFRVAQKAFAGDNLAPGMNPAGGVKPGDKFRGPGGNQQPNAPVVPVGGTAGSKVWGYAASHGVGSGTTYSTGGISPKTGYDCSGFVYAAYKSAGIDIPRTSEGQWFDDSPHCVHVPKGQEEVGDGVYFTGSGKYKPPGHCGIYVGGGEFVEYYQSGKPAKFAKLKDRGDYWGARRWVKLVQGTESTTKKSGGGAQAGGGKAATGPPGSTSLPPSATAKAKPKKPKHGKTGKKATYSWSQLKSLWIAAGGPAHVADIAAAVAVAESSGRSWVMNHNKNGSIDYGCWQINSVHRYDPASLIDGDQSYNAECAVAIYSGAGGFTPWSTYNNGAFEKFLGGAGSPKSSGAAYSSPTQDIASAQQAAGSVAASQAAARARIARNNAAGGGRATTVGFPGTTGGGLGQAVFTGDQLLPQALRNQLAQLQAKFNAETMMAGLLTGSAATQMQGAMQENLRAQAQAMADEIAHLKNLLRGSRGKQRKAILDELGKVNQALSSVNSQILTSLEGMVQAAQANVSSAFASVKAKIDAAFEAQTQRMVDALGAQFFQGGMTPAEKALKDYQDAQNQAGLQATLAAAQTPEEVKAAQDAITLDRLQAAATAERTAADKAYSEALTKLQAERQAQESALNDQLDKLLESVLNGTAGIGDLATIASEFGVTMSGSLIPDMANLTTATNELAKAFASLIAFVRKITGQAPGGTSGAAAGNPAAASGDSMWTQPGWWHGGLATGQPGRPAAFMVRARPGGTIARIGEGRHDEAVVPLNGSPLGEQHLHFHFGILTGRVSREQAREIANLVEPELARQIGFRR